MVGGHSPLQLLHPLLLLPAGTLRGLGGEGAAGRHTVGLSAIAALGQVLQREQAKPGTGAGSHPPSPPRHASAAAHPSPALTWGSRGSSCPGGLPSPGLSLPEPPSSSSLDRASRRSWTCTKHRAEPREPLRWHPKG